MSPLSSSCPEIFFFFSSIIFQIDFGAERTNYILSEFREYCINATKIDRLTKSKFYPHISNYFLQYAFFFQHFFNQDFLFSEILDILPYFNSSHIVSLTHQARRLLYISLVVVARARSPSRLWLSNWTYELSPSSKTHYVYLATHLCVLVCVWARVLYTFEDEETSIGSDGRGIVSSQLDYQDKKQGNSPPYLNHNKSVNFNLLQSCLFFHRKTLNQF